MSRRTSCSRLQEQSICLSGGVDTTLTSVFSRRTPTRLNMLKRGRANLLGLLAGFTISLAINIVLLNDLRLKFVPGGHLNDTPAGPVTSAPTPVTRTIPRPSDPFPGIQRILYINLDKRKDRRKAFEAAMAAQGIANTSYVRISATVDKNGAIGCLISHINALKYAAKHLKGENVIVFEDDVVFRMNRSETRRRLETFWANAEVSANWNVLMFATNIQPSGSRKSLVAGVVRITDALTAAALAINANYVRTILARKEQGLHYMRTYLYAEWFRNDQYVRPLQAGGFWYAFHPPLCQQSKSYSDIEKRVVNYQV